MKNGIYNELSIKCIDIIRNNQPKTSINIISNMKNENGEKIGKETALLIYNAYSKNSVNYDEKKYKNNISTYIKKVNSNISSAEKFVKKYNQ
jgi:hypothetical protein